MVSGSVASDTTRPAATISHRHDLVHGGRREMGALQAEPAVERVAPDAAALGEPS